MAALITVRAPVPVTELVCGVPFRGGVAQVDPAVDAQRRALAYFRQAGYVIEEPAAEPAAEQPPARVFESLPGSPSRGASKDSWVAFAVDGAPEGLQLSKEQAEALTRDQLAEKYLGPKED